MNPAIKDAKERRAKAQVRLDALAERMKPFNAEYKAIQREISEADRDLSFAKKQPQLSDHAVMRYLERHYGFEVEKLRKEILCNDVIAAINMGAQKVKYNGITFCVRNKVITTIY